jgi:hypothetical protein
VRIAQCHRPDRFVEVPSAKLLQVRPHLGESLRAYANVTACVGFQMRHPRIDTSRTARASCTPISTGRRRLTGTPIRSATADPRGARCFPGQWLVPLFSRHRQRSFNRKEDNDRGVVGEIASGTARAQIIQGPPTQTAHSTVPGGRSQNPVDAR